LYHEILVAIPLKVGGKVISAIEGM
jgi:hypothetical protein